MLFLFFVNAKLCEGIEGLLGWRTVGQEISIKFGEEGRKTNRQLFFMNKKKLKEIFIAVNRKIF